MHIGPKMSRFHDDGGRGPEKTSLAFLENVTFGLRGVGVKANLDNVTKYDFILLKASLKAKKLLSCYYS